MATSRPTGDEPYLQGTQPASGDTYYRPQVHRFELRKRVPMAWSDGVGPEVDQQKISELKTLGYNDEQISKLRWAGRGQKVGDQVPPPDLEANPYQAPGIEQERSLNRRSEAFGLGAAATGSVARILTGMKQVVDDHNSRVGLPPSAGLPKLPGSQYTSAEGIPFLRHDSSAPRLSAKNVGKFIGRSGVNAGLTAALDYGVDAATKESRQSIGEEIAAILKRKYGHEVDPITALTFYDQFMQNEGDLFHHKDVTTLGMQHDTAAGLMSMGVGSYNPVAGSAFNAARNVVERPGRMAQYEMLADRMNSEVTAGDVRNAAMRQYAGKYGVEGVKKRFPTLGWETWKPTGNE